MTVSPSTPHGRGSDLRSALAPHWKGHLFLFDPEPLEPYSARSGWRLLLILVIVEGVLGPRMGLLRWLGVGVPPPWLRVPLLIAIVLGLVRWFAGVRPSQLGFRPWARWTKAERSYFVQVLVLANVIFGSIYARQLHALFTGTSLWSSAVVVLVTNLLWGLYQELVYRGILQTELTRRWGPVAGILVANTVYTFGPLHFYHFSERTPVGAAAMFAGIFAIGLFFSILFRRSSSLWMVGVFHGLGDWYIVGLGSLVG